MTAVDLSQVITEAMPVYPGTEPPEIDEACSIARDGFAEKRIRFFSHTGTHIDAPGHILAGAPLLDDFEVGRFVGRGCVLDVSNRAGGRVDISDLEGSAPRIAAAEFVLLHTGWSRHWGRPAYFAGFPVLTEAAARFLAGFPLKGLGVDAISVDEMNSTAMAVHRALLAAGLLIIENLTGLETLLGREFLFSGLPLKLAKGDGSPVRAAALLPDEKDGIDIGPVRPWRT